MPKGKGYDMNYEMEMKGKMGPAGTEMKYLNMEKGGKGVKPKNTMYNKSKGSMGMDY